jgi:hypothetical protein
MWAARKNLPCPRPSPPSERFPASFRRAYCMLCTSYSTARQHPLSCHAVAAPARNRSTITVLACPAHPHPHRQRRDISRRARPAVPATRPQPGPSTGAGRRGAAKTRLRRAPGRCSWPGRPRACASRLTPRSWASAPAAPGRARRPSPSRPGACRPAARVTAACARGGAEGRSRGRGLTVAARRAARER